MRCPRSSAAAARRRPKKRRPTNSPHEIEAAIVWTPAAAYADEFELPDWIAGAN